MKKKIENCIRCKKKINKEVDTSEKYYICPKCNVSCANIHYNKKLKIYLSAGWFDEYQVKALEFLEENLFAREDFQVYSPRKEDQLKPGETFTKEVKQRVFNSNLKQINEADIIVSSTVGKDMGTLWEDGYAYALNKPIIYTFFDERFKDLNFNLMLSESGIAAFTVKKEFEDFLKNINKKNFKTKRLEYTGAIE